MLCDPRTARPAISVSIRSASRKPGSRALGIGALRLLAGRLFAARLARLSFKALVQRTRVVMPAGEPLNGASPVPPYEGGTEAPAPPHAITVATGVPAGGTGTKDKGGRASVDKDSRKTISREAIAVRTISAFAWGARTGNLGGKPKSAAQANKLLRFVKAEAGRAVAVLCVDLNNARGAPVASVNCGLYGVVEVEVTSNHGPLIFNRQRRKVPRE